MIVFIKLVKRASILHEKIFIYKDQLTILITQYLIILDNTSEYFQKQTHNNPTNLPTKHTTHHTTDQTHQTNTITNTPPNKFTHLITQSTPLI